MQALLSAGHTQQEVADVIGVDKSTISRERTKRSRSSGVYRADSAEHKASVKRSNAKHQGMKIEKHPELRSHIIEELKVPRSPDEIAGRMKAEGRKPRVGKDAIYAWLYSPRGQRYCRYLCTKRYRKKRQKKDKEKRHIIPDMQRIHELPEEANEEGRAGHWEGDTFVSPKRLRTTASAALLAEKHSKLLAGVKLSSLKPDEMAGAVQAQGGAYVMRTLVLDRGIENRNHKQFGVDSYFCDPHAPWQKPLAEGSIGLLRRWFWPKGTNLEHIQERELQDKLAIINGKYRKSLNYKSALEVAREYDILKS